MAQLVDSSVPIDSRKHLATQMSELRDCCVEALFAQPVLDTIRRNGGVQSLFHGELYSHIELAFRGATSNVEIELNFARAATSRRAMQGRSHNIGSLVAKHISSEIKLGHRRSLSRSSSHVQNLNPGKMSRKTGFHLFLADIYRSEHHDTGSSTDDWSETRQRIFRTALMKWKEQTYEMRCARNRLSEEAKQFNYVANLKREQQLALQNQQELAQKNLDSLVSSHQLQLLDYAIEEGFVCPNGMNPRPPSILRPAALVDYAKTQKASLDEAMDVGEIVEYQPTRDIVPLTDNSVVESVMAVIQHGQGLHGLADNQFGLSEAIVAHAAQIPGFVANSNLQFHAEHSDVSKEGPPIHVNSIDDIGCAKSCQQLCGRFCRQDIRTETIPIFRNTVEMMKNITRVLACKRNVKHGNTHFLSPQCKLPLLIICTPSKTYARLAARFTFNPLEIDWIWCDATRGGISDDIAFTVFLANQ